jgi:hypothetical protein
VRTPVMNDPGPAAQARYLFAVARGLEKSALVATPGLRGAPLEIIEHRELQAVVCAVDLDEFGEDKLAHNLEDLGWLEEVARCHHNVVYVVASAGTVAPMRLVTICSDDESVRARIEDVYDDLSHALSRVQGRSEWSVKVYAPRQQTLAPDETERPASGAAYLQRKREQAAQRRTSGERSIQVAEEINQALTESVTASRMLPPQDPRLTGREDMMILNGAYLVPNEDGEGFRNLVERLTDLHPALQIELMGPWPPYSFATLD